MNQAINSAADFAVVYSYTRAQALADGVLHDVSEAAKGVGFKIPVAVTEAVWNGCVAWTDQDSREQTSQDQTGRLHDLVWMAYVAVRRAPKTSASDRLLFNVLRVPRDGRSKNPAIETLKLVIHPGDDGQPVFTIMEQLED